MSSEGAQLRSSIAPDVKLCAIGSPRVGDAQFAIAFTQLSNLVYLRFVDIMGPSNFVLDLDGAILTEDSVADVLGRLLSVAGDPVVVDSAQILVSELQRQGELVEAWRSGTFFDILTKQDLVTRVPPVPFIHVGEELLLDSTQVSFVL